MPGCQGTLRGGSLGRRDVKGGSGISPPGGVKSGGRRTKRRGGYRGGSGLMRSVSGLKGGRKSRRSRGSRRSRR